MAEPPQPKQEPHPESSLFQQFMSMAPRMLFIYFVMQYMQGNFSTKPVILPSQGATGIPLNEKSLSLASNLESAWRLGEQTALFVYLGPSPEFRNFDDPKSLLFQSHEIGFGNFDHAITKEFVIPCTQDLRNNGSLYAHIYLARNAFHPRQLSSETRSSILYRRKALTRFMRKKKIIKKKNLVKKEESEVAVIEGPEEVLRPIISYWYNNLTINVIAMDNQLSSAQPPHILEMIEVDDSKSLYLPIMYLNDFWLLQENLMPINSSVTSLNLNLHFSPLAFWKFTLYAQFEESLRVQVEVMGQDPSENDAFKRMFIETNPILLGVTMGVSLLHSVFDFLAFKNDIQFWQGKKDMEGISFRSIILNIIFQSIIFLYLMDNETSYMILASTGIGILIEVWKINKTVIVKVSFRPNSSGSQCFLTWMLLIGSNLANSLLKLKNMIEWPFVIFLLPCFL
jgi:hypothetical protein